MFRRSAPRAPVYLSTPGPQELYQALVNTSPDAITIVDCQGRLSFDSPSAVRQFEMESVESVLGQSVLNWVDARDQARAIAEIKDALYGIPVTDSVYHLHTSQGKPFMGEINAAPLYDRLGRPTGLIAIIRDVTERWHSEEVLKTSEKQLRSSLSRLIQADQVIQRKVDELQLLRSIDLAIVEHDEVAAVLDALVRRLADFFQADAVEIMLYDPDRAQFQQIAGQGFCSDVYMLPCPVQAGAPGLALTTRKPVYLPDLPAHPEIYQVPFYVSEGFTASYTIPLLTPNSPRGVLQLFYRDGRQLEPANLDFFEMVANQVAIALEKTTLWEKHQSALRELVTAYETTLEGWAHALDLRDNDTEHHTRRVTEMTVRVAQEMGISGESLTDIRRGALLHDIGKIGIPDSILRKPGPLNEDEWIVMRRHPTLAYTMLAPIDYLRRALEIPYCHHERWDGSGYPRGLRGEEIPLSARIFAVADVWDALTSTRPYREAWNEAQAAAYLRENAGIQFDPEPVRILLAMVEKPDTRGE
jgi:PAS domain S-box-containing protein